MLFCVGPAMRAIQPSADRLCIFAVLGAARIVYDDSMNSWSDIHVFLSVMDHGSAAAAARVLGTNQTTVSRRIERLEAHLRLTLFERGPRGAHPTDAARRLLPEARAMAQAAAGFMAEAGTIARRLSGTIHLTANPTAMRYAGGLIRQFQAAHPEAQFRLNTDARTLSLEAGEADVALRLAVRLTGDTLVARKLFDHPWGFFASDRYLVRHGTPRSFSDLARHNLVCLSGDGAQIDLIQTAQTRLPPHEHRLHVDSVDGLIGLLRADEGVGFLPRAIGDLEPGLSFCFSEPDLVQGLWVVTSRAGHADPLIRAFTAFCGRAVPRLRAELPREWWV